MFALMVRNYLQFELRRTLAATDKTVRGRKKRVRTKIPTAETALLNFMGLSSVWICLGDRFLQRKVEKMKPDALTILELLHVPPEVFWMPFDKWPPLAPETSGT